MMIGRLQLQLNDKRNNKIRHVIYVDCLDVDLKNNGLKSKKSNFFADVSVCIWI